MKFSDEREDYLSYSRMPTPQYGSPKSKVSPTILNFASVKYAFTQTVALIETFRKGSLVFPRLTLYWWSYQTMTDPQIVNILQMFNFLMWRFPRILFLEDATRQIHARTPFWFYFQLVHLCNGK
jgi:hypothetical protein